MNSSVNILDNLVGKVNLVTDVGAMSVITSGSEATAKSLSSLL